MVNHYTYCVMVSQRGISMRAVQITFYTALRVVITAKSYPTVRNRVIFGWTWVQQLVDPNLHGCGQATHPAAANGAWRHCREQCQRRS